MTKKTSKVRLPKDEIELRRWCIEEASRIPASVSKKTPDIVKRAGQLYAWVTKPPEAAQ